MAPVSFSAKNTLMQVAAPYSLGYDGRPLGREWLVYISSTVFIFLLFFQNIDIVKFPGADADIKVFHLFGLITLMLFPVANRAMPMPVLPSLFFIIAFAVSLYNAPRFGLSGRVVTLLYSAAFFYYFYHIAQLMSYDRLLKYFQNLSLLVYAGVALKIAFFWHIFSRGYSADYNSAFYFYPGGSNIEITWMALFLLFFLRKPLAFFLLLFAYVTAIALIYESRVGQLILLIILGLYAAHRCHARVMYGITLLILGAVAALATQIDFEALSLLAKNYGVGRFAEIGEQDGFGKRVMMWGLAMPFIEKEWLTGYGIGQIIPKIRDETAVNIVENNLHNIYLQFLSELGVFTLAAFCFIIVQTLHRYFTRRGIAPELALFIVGYAIAGFVQFTGFEILFWMVAGLYYGYCLKTGIEKNHG